MTRLLVQMRVAGRLGLSTLPQRKGSALVIVICMACVVGVLLSVLSVTNGAVRAANVAGSPARAIVFSTDSGPGVRVEEGSHISQDDLAILGGAPGVKDELVPESLAILPPVEGFAFGTLFVRGIGANSLAMRPEFQIRSGRLFRPGLHEIIVGLGAARAFGLKVGDRMIMPDGEWPIVGAFSAGGGILEGELIGDAATVMSAIKRTTDFSSVLVDLESPAAFEGFKRWIASNPALSLTADRQSDYYERVARNYSGFFTAVAYVVGVIMALGALFGSVKILHAVVDSRAREIATLRAIGYEAFPVATSVVLEAVVLSLIGALIGATMAHVLFDGKLEAIFNAVFTLSISPRLIALGLAWACLLAVLGGIAPAIRSARRPVAEALRQA